MSQQEMTWGKAIEALGHMILKVMILCVPGALVIGALNLMGFGIAFTLQTWFGAQILCILVIVLANDINK